MNFKSFCKQGTNRIAIIVALLACIASNQSHAATVSNETKLPAAIEYQVGSMHVAQYSNSKNKGLPIVLIPGLSSGGYVWDDTVKQLGSDHDMYVITLAGFNGTAPVAGPVMDKAKESLRELIASKKIDKPILVGHSLGATLSIWFAESHSDMIRGVFAVDGLAVLPRTENMSREQRVAMAQGMKASAASLNQEMFTAQQMQYMETQGVIDPALAKTLGALSAKSNPAAFVDYFTEDIVLDLRKDLPAVTVPLTIVSPYYEKDLAPIGMSEQQKVDYYKSLHVGAPKLNVVSIKESRHFPMYDQAKEFGDKLQSFVQTFQ